MKKTILALALVVFLPGVALAIAQGGDGSPRMGMHHGPCAGNAYKADHRLLKALNLSPEQSQKMKELRERFFGESVPLWNEIRSKRLELQALWMQTNPEEGRILAKQKEIGALRTEVQEKATRHRLALRKILTPEQQAKIGR